MYNKNFPSTWLIDRSVHQSINQSISQSISLLKKGSNDHWHCHKNTNTCKSRIKQIYQKQLWVAHELLKLKSANVCLKIKTLWLRTTVSEEFQTSMIRLAKNVFLAFTLQWDLSNFKPLLLVQKTAGHTKKFGTLFQLDHVGVYNNESNRMQVSDSSTVSKPRSCKRSR